jgi:uncharacterized membrane protein HdeD (DUF308 family)
VQTLIKSWWLLALCGVLDALISIINFDHAGSGFNGGTVMYELATARTSRRRRHVADEWLLGAAGVVSVGFALGFLAFVFRWIKMEPGPAQTVLWLGSYFAFSGICMLALGLRYAPPLRSISR